MSTNPPSVATPATPSAMAWCIFMKSPTRPSGKPGRNHISHNGRVRCSGRRRSVSHAQELTHAGNEVQPSADLLSGGLDQDAAIRDGEADHRLLRAAIGAPVAKTAQQWL